MRILDLYILRRFCLSLLFSAIVFILIVIFVDMIGNLAKFIDKDVPQPIIVQYYLYYVPQILVLALPIAMLLSSLFCFGQLSRYNELAAIKSAGISLSRTLLPIFLLGLLISLGALSFGEIVLPKANQEKTQIENAYLDPFGERNQRWQTNIYLRDSQDRRIFISRFDTEKQLAEKVSIQKYLGSEIVERFDAPEMKWKDSTWVLIGGYSRKFANDFETAAPLDSLFADDLGVRPEQVSYFKVEPKDMSYTELRRFIQELRRNGGDPKRWLVELHFKLSLPFASLIMVVFGAPLASRRNRGGAVFGVIVSLFICFFYYGTNKLIQTMGENGVVPAPIAAWTTNFVFLLAGLLLLFYSRK